MRKIFAIAVAAAAVISVPAFAQTAGSQPTWSDQYNRVAGPAWQGPRPGYYDNGYTGESAQPTWSVEYNRVSNPAWRGPGPGYYANGYSGENSQPSWSVQYNRVVNPTGFGW